MSKSQVVSKQGEDVGEDVGERGQLVCGETVCLGTDTFIPPAELSRIARQYSGKGHHGSIGMNMLFC